MKDAAIPSRAPFSPARSALYLGARLGEPSDHRVGTRRWSKGRRALPGGYVDGDLTRPVALSRIGRSFFQRRDLRILAPRSSAVPSPKSTSKAQHRRTNPRLKRNAQRYPIGRGRYRRVLRQPRISATARGRFRRSTSHGHCNTNPHSPSISARAGILGRVARSFALSWTRSIHAFRSWSSDPDGLWRRHFEEQMMATH